MAFLNPNPKEEIMQETETTQTGGDDLRSQIMSAMEDPDDNTELETVDSDLAEDDPIAEEAQEARDDGRDDKGRFKKKEPQAQDAPEDADTENSEDQKQDLAPPQHWKGGGKIDWNKLPKGVKQAIAEDYQALQDKEQQYQGLEQVLNPRRDVLSAEYGSVENAIDYLFKLSDFAGNDPQGFIQWFAQQRGVNMQAPQDDQPDEGNQLRAALQKIQQLEQQVSQLPTQFQHQSQTSALKSQIQSFASDPNNVYFNDVKHIMAGFLQSGAAQDLQQAYDMAIHADPNIRAAIMAEQREKEAVEKQRKAQAAKKAAGSMSGSPINGASMDDEPAATVREEIMRAMSASRI